MVHLVSRAGIRPTDFYGCFSMSNATDVDLAGPCLSGLASVLPCFSIVDGLPCVMALPMLRKVIGPCMDGCDDYLQ